MTGDIWASRPAWKRHQKPWALGLEANSSNIAALVGKGTKSERRRALPREVTVDVTQDLHQVRVDRRQGHAGGLPHVDRALLRQVHVVEVDELELGLLFRPAETNQ